MTEHKQCRQMKLAIWQQSRKVLQIFCSHRKIRKHVTLITTFYQEYSTFFQMFYITTILSNASNISSNKIC